MKARQIMHPADAKALQVLKQARGFNTLIKYFMKVGEERIMRGRTSVRCFVSRGITCQKSIPLFRKSLTASASTSRSCTSTMTL